MTRFKYLFLPLFLLLSVQSVASDQTHRNQSKAEQCEKVHRQPSEAIFEGNNESTMVSKFTSLKDVIIANRNSPSQLKPLIQNLVENYSSEVEAGDILVALFLNTNRPDVRTLVFRTMPAGMPIGKLSQRKLQKIALFERDQKGRLAEDLFWKASRP